MMSTTLLRALLKLFTQMRMTNVEVGELYELGLGGIYYLIIAMNEETAEAMRYDTQGHVDHVIDRNAIFTILCKIHVK